MSYEAQIESMGPKSYCKTKYKGDQIEVGIRI
jgi:hypothetical protein